MAEFHPLPTASSPELSAQWREWNVEAADRARQFLADHPSLEMDPFLQHLTYKDYEQLYEPAEDTYLLMDAIRYEMDSFSNVPVCLEIGCGTGIVSAMITQLVPQSIVLATDINPKAVASAQALGVESVLCDFATAIRGTVDILIFNPPYVPTPDEEIKGTGLEVSWAGGIHGRKVVDRWVNEALTKVLDRPHGVAYLVTVDDNHPEQLSQQLALRSLTMRPLFRRRAKNEYLTVQKITWDII